MAIWKISHLEHIPPSRSRSTAEARYFPLCKAVRTLPLPSKLAGASPCRCQFAKSMQQFVAALVRGSSFNLYF